MDVCEHAHTISALIIDLNYILDKAKSQMMLQFALISLQFATTTLAATPESTADLPSNDAPGQFIIFLLSNLIIGTSAGMLYSWEKNLVNRMLGAGELSG